MSKRTTTCARRFGRRARSDRRRRDPPVIATPFPNQPPPYEGRNLYRSDVALQEAVARASAASAETALERWGETLGSAETFALAEAANRNAPRLRTHDPRA